MTAGHTEATDARTDDFLLDTRKRLELLISADWINKPPSIEHLAEVTPRLTLISDEANAAWQLAGDPVAKSEAFVRHYSASLILKACRSLEQGNRIGAQIFLWEADRGMPRPL